MCGICGIYSRRLIGCHEISLLENMSAALNLRGPDSHGIYRGSNIGMAIRRLSIIDVSGGTQPLFDETGSLVLVANAEIYNYVELSKELKGRGHIFRTGSDCETILHLYQEEGVNCLKHLRGMFAFALWDNTKRSLFIARDRLGEKPLYMYEDEDYFIFASEFKALKKAIPQTIVLDSSAVNLFFHYQYVPEPATLIKGVRKLGAGHYMYINADNAERSVKRYWDIQDAPPLEGSPPVLIRQGLQELMPFVLRSDVPVGIALSGGIDSGAIAALAAKEYKNDLFAFSVGYSGAHDCDERGQARELAGHLGLRFRDVEISVSDFVRDFPRLVYSMDDPIADIAAYGYYSVMRLARENKVPVMLSGFAGDELFWGYPWVKAAVNKNLRKLRLFSSHSFNPVSFLARKFASPKNRMIFYETSPNFKESHDILPRLYSKNFISSIDYNNVFTPFTIDDTWEPVDIKICRLIFNLWLTSNCIPLGDRLSMASSVEIRLPFLDYKFVELVIGLRKTQHDYNLVPKAWFKEALKGILLDSVLTRSKRGFSPPHGEWIRAAFSEYGGLLTGGYLAENKIFDPQTLKIFIKSAIANSSRLDLAYKILVLEMWCRLFLLNKPVDSLEFRKR